MPADCKKVLLPVTVKVDAAEVDLRDLVPKFVIDGREIEVAGQLDWKVDGKLQLDPKPSDGEPALAADTALDGELRLEDALVSIPKSKRTYRNIQARIRHDARTVNIERLELHEGDRDKKDRTVDVHGRIDLEKWKPSKLYARLRTKDWLLFGGDLLGPADAPRGTITIDVTARAQLDQPVQRIDVDVADLELLIPGRFARAHQPEDTHLGDVIYLNPKCDPSKDPSCPQKGKIPLSETAFRKLHCPAPIALAKPQPQDITITIAEPVHLQQHPLDVWASGRIEVKRRDDEPGPTIRGALAIVRGNLSLGGRGHDLETGSITFSASHPKGYMDMHFARREPNATLRDISKKSGGDEVKISLVGPIGKHTTTLSGAGSPGTLFDLLSVHNVGRVRYLSAPDMPSSVATEYPQFDNLLLMSYLAVNVPHLLFLDRVSAWADPYDGRGTHAYGDIRNYESEGYSADGNWRLRMTGRPPAAGTSEAEINYDLLLHNSARSAAGVGLGAGSRLGGGPSVFFEWSSDD